MFFQSCSVQKRPSRCSLQCGHKVPQYHNSESMVILTGRRKLFTVDNTDKSMWWRTIERTTIRGWERDGLMTPALFKVPSLQRGIHLAFLRRHKLKHQPCAALCETKRAGCGRAWAMSLVYTGTRGKLKVMCFFESTLYYTVMELGCS